MKAHVYSDAPLRSVLMIGSAVPTTVWSSANRNSESRIASRISSFWRELRFQLWPSSWTAAAACVIGAPSGSRDLVGGPGSMPPIRRWSLGAGLRERSSHPLDLPDQVDADEQADRLEDEGEEQREAARPEEVAGRLELAADPDRHGGDHGRRDEQHRGEAKERQAVALRVELLEDLAEPRRQGVQVEARDQRLQEGHRGRSPASTRGRAPAGSTTTRLIQPA